MQALHGGAYTTLHHYTADTRYFLLIILYLLGHILFHSVTQSPVTMLYYIHFSSPFMPFMKVRQNMNYLKYSWDILFRVSSPSTRRVSLITKYFDDCWYGKNPSSFTHTFTDENYGEIELLT